MNIMLGGTTSQNDVDQIIYFIIYRILFHNKSFLFELFCYYFRKFGILFCFRIGLSNMLFDWLVIMMFDFIEFILHVCKKKV